MLLEASIELPKAMLWASLLLASPTFASPLGQTPRLATCKMGKSHNYHKYDHKHYFGIITTTISAVFP